MKLWLICFWVALLTGLFFEKVMAAEPLTERGVAYVVEVASQTQVVDGMIVQFDGESYGITNEVYDSQMIGVAETTPGMVIETEGVTGVPVISDGQVEVLLKSGDEEIKSGDWITSSEEAGLGMKANEPGWVIGRVLQLRTTEAGENRVVLISADPHFEVNPLGDELPLQTPITNILRGALTDLFSAFNRSTTEEPSVIFRYILATLVILVSVVFSYMTFGRVARSGVEAIGRNPLAQKAIMAGVIFNVLFGLMIIFGGIVVAYYIIRL